ncbi:MAG: type II 3-dehydroquinate dehydratase [Alphaproteobacteria bacterium]|nr:MAG: type II 3-dehydroquinate dehydratase [Alphaproteobacteria bacterium]
MARRRQHSLFVLNGPNLNLLGTREPEIYGTESLADIEKMVRAHADAQGLATIFRQSNHEGALIDWVQEAMRSAHGLIINPGGLTHSSVALRDAVAAAGLPTVEVHLSNIFKREAFRHHSYVSGVAWGIISGLGIIGYALAVDALASRLAVQRR